MAGSAGGHSNHPIHLHPVSHITLDNVLLELKQYCVES